MNALITSMLEQIPVFAGLDHAELDGIAPLFTEQRYKKGSVIFVEGDIGEEMYLIKSGVVKIHRLEQTREIILALFREGEYFGEMALLSLGQTRSATAETLEATVLFVLSRDDFYKFLERTPKLALKLLEITMERLRRTNEQIEDLTFLDVRSRIFKLIIRLGDQYGRPFRGGVLVDMKLTHQQLASMAGTVRESVTKVLQELQHENIIVIEKKMIIINDGDALSRKIMY